MIKTIFKKKIFILICFMLLLNWTVTANAGIEDINKLQYNADELVLYHIKQGNFVEAETILKGELYKHPKDLKLLYPLAELYISTDQYSKAYETLNKIQAIAPKSPDLAGLRSALYLKTLQFDKADNLANQALVSNPRSSNAYKTIGNIYLQKNKKEKNNLKKEENLDNSLKAFYNASKYNPKSAEPHIGMAKVYFAQKKIPRTLNEIYTADELEIYNPDSQYFVADFYYKIDNYEKAITALKKPLLYNSKTNPRAHILLAKIYEQLGNLDDSQSEYNKALKIEPGNIEARTRLTAINHIIKLDKDYKLAEKIKINVNNSDLVKMAEKNLLMDKLAEARELFLKILKNDPNNTDAIAGLMEFYYSQWGLGYFNPENYFFDSSYFEDPDKKAKLTIPDIKLRIIASPKITDQIKEELATAMNNKNTDFYSQLNALRAAFLTENYLTARTKLNQLLNKKLTDLQKYEIAKSLYYDRDFYDAKIVTNIMKNPFNDDALEKLKAKIQSRKDNVIKMQADGVAFFKKKEYAYALSKYEECTKYYPTYSDINIDYATTLKKLNYQKEALEKLNKYSELEKIYPSDNTRLTPEQFEKMKKSLTKK